MTALRAAYADILQLYCEAVVSYNCDRGLVERSGPLLKGARGREVIRNPVMSQVRAMADQREFSRASRTISATTSGSMGGRPGPRPG